LTGRDGALTPLIKKLLEASLEGEIKNHLSAESEKNNRRNGRNAKSDQLMAQSSASRITKYRYKILTRAMKERIRIIIQNYLKKWGLR